MLFSRRTQATPPPEDPRHRDGRNAEQRAFEFLSARGLHPVARNFRCARGEIDLVLRDGTTLVFVEVRARNSARYGGGAASVDARKQAKLVASAEVFLQQHPAYNRSACRFDVVAVDTRASPPAIDWIPDAFQSSG